MTNFDSSRLDKYIKRKYGNIPQSIIEKAIRNKDILLNGKKVQSSTQVTDNDNVFIHPNIIKVFQIVNSNNIKQTNNVKNYSTYLDTFKQMIIYEDNNLVIINKPSGLAVQLGSKTKIALDVMAKAYNPELRLVHRIDKDTSGITIMVKNLKTARYMLLVFRNKLIQKKYIALLSKVLTKSSGTINAPLFKCKDRVLVDEIKGKEAITNYKVIRNVNGCSLIEAIPLTGRTHQIRVHMAHIGAPILGDSKYDGKKNKHLFLHAYEVSFKDINTHSLIKIKAPLPEYMSSCSNIILYNNESIMTL
ncbi:MAG: RluA family pseudouridine synthase [Alphaproteobacteria bacterium]|nr:RluA family pseudouridine synthase [Alphaproteobacteria bacterium]